MQETSVNPGKELKRGLSTVGPHRVLAADWPLQLGSFCNSKPSLLSLCLCSFFHQPTHIPCPFNLCYPSIPYPSLFSSHSPCSTIRDRDDKTTSHCQIAHHLLLRASNVNHGPKATNTTPTPPLLHDTTASRISFFIKHIHCWQYRTL